MHANDLNLFSEKTWKRHDSLYKIERENEVEGERSK